MRYAALNQGMDLLARYGDFIPARTNDVHDLPSDFLAVTVHARYSDEQLYALALYIYSLEPPPNPNTLDALAIRGRQIFEDEGCGRCHPPPLYTDNKLNPAPGFAVPDDHDILRRSVGTDPSLTLTTRRGTGYYRVPSLKGAWYGARSNTTARWRRLKIGSIRAACAMTTCRPAGRDMSCRPGRSRGTSSDWTCRPRTSGR